MTSDHEPTTTRSPDPGISSMDRISRIEGRVNLIALVALAALVTVIAGYASPGATTLRAEKFELVSTSGEVLATLEASDENGTGLFVRDNSGRVRISISHSPDETALFIKDAHGDTRLGAAQFGHGGVGLALHGDEMKGAAVMYLSNRKGSFRVFDENGTVVKQITADK